MAGMPSGALVDRRGAATLELALVLPLLILLFAAICDFGRIFHYSVIVTTCARNGALYLSDTRLADKSPYDSVEEAALADAAGLSPVPTVVATTGLHSSSLEFVEVTVDYPFRMLTRLPGVPETISISRRIRMIRKPSQIATAP